MDLFKLNTADLRDQIVFGENFNAKKYGGGLRRFDKLTLPQINELDALGLLEMDECQNDCPSVGEIIDFLRNRVTDGWYVHGYCISPERYDFRISFEGVGKSTPPSKQDIIDFAAMFRWADEFQADNGGLWCWYD